jgi:hypothetical protein
LSSVGKPVTTCQTGRPSHTLFSLIKDQKQRPKYAKLKNLPFIKKYETKAVNVGEWVVKALKEADAVANTTAPRYVAWLVSNFFNFFYYNFNRLLPAV